MKIYFTILTFLLFLIGCSDNNQDENVSVQTEVQASFTKNSFSSSANGNIGYWLYTPKNATANMPMIVYLHGGSGRGSDLNLVIAGSLPKFISEGTVKDIPAYVLIPQCPENKTWEQIATSVIELTDYVKTSKSINANKISLTGHSLGGTGTWKLGADYSSKFSCIAPLSGSVNVGTASSYINLPVFAIVGSADTIVDPALSTNIVPAINQQGGNAQIKVYNNATHFDVPDLAYKDSTLNIISWLISKTK